MKPFKRNYLIKATAVLEQKQKEFTSIEECSKSTGISEYMLKQIRMGKRPSLIRGRKDRLFQIDFSYDVVSSLTPAWDTSNDEEPALTKEFSSHHAAIAFLGTSKSTYYRRMRMQALGEPCSLPIKDIFNREWIAVFYKKDEFVPNKSE
jgi:hypothetical protein